MHLRGCGFGARGFSTPFRAHSSLTEGTGWNRNVLYDFLIHRAIQLNVMCGLLIGARGTISSEVLMMV